jgi:two-component system OmpR family sensor kinase
MRPAERPGDVVSAPRGSRIQRVPLRITLVAVLLALVAVALTATGVAATSLLTSYLRDQQSDELRATATAYARDPQLEAACVNPPLRVLRAPTYLACLAPGSDEVTVIAAPPSRDERVPDLDEDDVAELRDGSGPSTVSSSGPHDDWLMTAERLPNGYTLVVGSDVGRDDLVIGRLVAIEIVVGLVVLTLLGATGYVLVGNSLRPLGEVERTAKAIAAGDLSQRVPEGDERTEVGRLSSALNGMLARIESAFRAQQESEERARGSAERMRRFVADASHELRTPLTSIRGFAELYRQGAVRDPEEVGRLMQRIEAEGARMGLLVEDLLLLARLDQQRPLTIAPVDLAEVAGDAVHDAQAVQPDRPIGLRLDDSLTEVPVVLGDEARLRQVVGNLVTNALTHTPPSARVTLTLAEDPGSPDVVVLQVADEGPGMAREHAGHVFERFYRADNARTRAAGGTGLGLSIVASLVAAHGGTVDLITAQGQGAVFTVRLPRSGPPGRLAEGPDPSVPG